ncbi:MAG: SDR family oxidoreductase [Betaproteobacteria bacterium]|nr:SDR family oxidoreductase [Betaproteobacteria bacterium]
MPNCNAMGLAKGIAGSVRALRGGAPRRDSIRVNGISAGPIKTLAAAGISNFGRIFPCTSRRNAPIRRTARLDR